MDSKAMLREEYHKRNPPTLSYRPTNLMLEKPSTLHLLNHPHRSGAPVSRVHPKYSSANNPMKMKIRY